YHPRGSFGALARQYFRYGRGRARTLVKHGRFLSIRPAIPAGLVLVGAALLATSWAQPLTPVAAAAYAGLTGIEAVRVGRQAGVGRIPTAWGGFPGPHVSHGVGFPAGPRGRIV